MAGKSKDLSVTMLKSNWQYLVRLLRAVDDCYEGCNIVSLELSYKIKKIVDEKPTMVFCIADHIESAINKTKQPRR